MNSIFINARVVGSGIDSEAYQEVAGDDGQAIQRGDRRYPMSRSALMNFMECPARWLKGFSRKDSDATDWGNLVDLAVLSPAKAKFDLVVAPENYPCESTKKDSRTEKPWNRNAAYCREWEADALAVGHIVLTARERADLTAATATLRADSEISELLACSKTQVLVVAEYLDRETGFVVPVKGLLDLVPDKDHQKFGKCIADLKTAATANPSLWTKFVSKFNYDAQAAFYLDLYVAATGEDRTDFLHVIQENYAPWEVGRRLLSAEFIELGRRKYLNALSAYCRCLKSGSWPSYDVTDWTLCEPEPWAMTQAMRQIPELEEPEEDEEAHVSPAPVTMEFRD